MMAIRRRILITGAGGNIGIKIRSHLEVRDEFDLTLIDRVPGGDRKVIAADLSRYDASWSGHFQGIDTVLHLAADPRIAAQWEDLEGPNVDATINTYEAAVAGGVARVIFASSLQTATGHLGRRRSITTDPPANPLNFYGVTKIFGERLGRNYAERHGLSVICLRIGTVRNGDNLPRGRADDIWQQQRWLSNRDLCQGFERAIRAEDVRFAVVNLTSDNVGTPWDLTQTHRTLGFVPSDRHRPLPLSWKAHLRRRAGRWKQRLARRIHHRGEETDPCRTQPEPTCNSTTSSGSRDARRMSWP